MSITRLDTQNAAMAAIISLCGQMEALADGSVYSHHGARTPRGAVHEAFVNGVQVQDGAGGWWPSLSLSEACAATLAAAAGMRAAIPGDAVLVWRIYPEWDGTRIYTRFCFEPLTDAASAETDVGEWVRNRIHHLVHNPRGKPETDELLYLSAITTTARGDKT